MFLRSAQFIITHSLVDLVLVGRAVLAGNVTLVAAVFAIELLHPETRSTSNPISNEGLENYR